MNFQSDFKNTNIFTYHTTDNVFFWTHEFYKIFLYLRPEDFNEELDESTMLQFNSLFFDIPNEVDAARKVLNPLFK